jgi:NitT/TauT family transport system substrate-binding protein
MRYASRLVALVLTLAAACTAPGSAPSSALPAPVLTAPAATDPGAAVPATPPGEPPPVVARLHVPHSSLSQTHAALWVAIEQGFFRQRGLEVETSYISGGSTIAAALVSGQAALILSGAAGPLAAAAQGAEFVFLGTGSEGLPFRLMTPPGIADPQDLRGKSMAVAGRGSTIETAALLLLQHWGWERNRELRLVNTGSTTNVYEALLTGATESAMVADPYADEAARQGYRVLYDMLEFPVPYASSCLITTRGYLERERALLRAFMEAYVEGAAVALSDKAAALDVVNKYLPADDPSVNATAWERTRRELRAVPRVSLRGLETVRRTTTDDNPALATFDPAQVADDSILDELEQSGFIAGTLRKYGLNR